MAIEKEVLDRLLAGRDPADVFSRDGLLDDLKKALSERILNAELDEHLDEERAGEKANRRNSTSRKSVLTGTSKIDLAIPRDRAGTFDPKLIAKYQRRFPDFDAKIVSMYARGMTVREIRGHLEELYGIDVSPDLISAVTDAVLEEVAEWQARPLDACYPLVFFDAIRVKIRDEGFVRNKAVFIALGVLPDGTKEILGLWIEQSSSDQQSIQWIDCREDGRQVLAARHERTEEPWRCRPADRHRRRAEGLSRGNQRGVPGCGRPDLHRASHPPFPGVRAWKDRKLVVPALRAIYRATDEKAGIVALEAFEAGPWGKRYPAIAQSWRHNWTNVVPFFAYPKGVRRIVYTTNAIEALNSKLRRAVRTRGHFPNDDAAMKLLYLVLNQAAAEWKRPPREWVEAKTQFAVVFGERFVIA